MPNIYGLWFQEPFGVWFLEPEASNIGYLDPLGMLSKPRGELGALLASLVGL